MPMPMFDFCIMPTSFPPSPTASTIYFMSSFSIFAMLYFYIGEHLAKHTNLWLRQNLKNLLMLYCIAISKTAPSINKTFWYYYKELVLILLSIKVSNYNSFRPCIFSSFLFLLTSPMH